MLIRCWLPPESVPAWSWRRSPRAGLREHLLDRRLDVGDLLEAGEEAQVLLDREPPVERRLLGHEADLVPSGRWISPASARWIPARIESSVVLPAPFGPITASSSPGAALKPTSRSAWRSPKLLLTPRASMAAEVVAGAFIGDSLGLR